MKWSGNFHRWENDVVFDLEIGCEESGKMMDLIVQYLRKSQHDSFQGSQL